ncbi:carotenoid ester lipase-like protein precursor [Corynespora cassiicola Philippines]|uniref:Carboxylic ester hydrolase n=1 Tax=Corynespora cassiicola Philippines TaxID=1448308 RepID=A0A2T2NP68_CORCC|nr:carotenoid ester lipase-like protein precursor [Corynespora cassiicola Philippines]
MRLSRSFNFFSALGLGLARDSTTVKNGTLVGLRNSHYDQDFFLGIPYAQPPVGKLRFNRAQPANETWSQRPATAYGPWCHSIPIVLPGFTQNGFDHEESEDCLTLNVVRPSGIDEATRIPVLTWIYGGGFMVGGGADQRYNMSFIVEESVKMGKPIIGYGFLSGSAVKDAGLYNLGLHDQRLALSWIQENIGAFGGDSSLVTVFGESAGAFSVGALYYAYGGRDDGLFSAAIAQSGSAALPLIQNSLEPQDASYNQIINRAGCSDSTDSLECLRSKDVETLNAAFAGNMFIPSVDDELVVQSASQTAKDGKFIKRPLLIGVSHNEGTALMLQGGQVQFAVNNSAEFRTWVSESWPGIMNTTVDTFVTEYLEKFSADTLEKELGTVLQSPSPKYGALFGNAALYLGDRMFDAPRRLTAEAWANNRVPVFSYRFNVAPSDMDPKVFGVTHFQEIPFVFRNYDGVGFEKNKMASNSTEIRRKYKQVAKLMSRMWISFANDHSPNGHGVTEFQVDWPAYTNGSAVNMLFGLNETNLEKDTYRSSAIRSLIDSYSKNGF